MTIYRVRLERDGDDVILPFPDELLDQLGWGEGTNVEFTDLGDGSFRLTKVEDGA